MSSCGSAIKHLFKITGDKMGSMPDGKAKLNVVIPTNIRLNFYENRDEIKLENKFAILPI